MSTIKKNSENLKDEAVVEKVIDNAIVTTINEAVADVVVTVPEAAIDKKATEKAVKASEILQVKDSAADDKKTSEKNDKETEQKKQLSVLVLCAHNDDQILGAGGTLIKYTNDGANLTTVICSYGESSNPLEKDNITINTRIHEAEESDKILGGKRIVFLALQDLKLSDELTRPEIKEKVAKLINETKPDKIFTHSDEDNHPDHKAVNRFIKELVKDKIINCDVFTFQVWSFIGFKNRDTPKLVVDVSDTFKKKIKSFDCHKSQRATRITVLWNIYLQAFLNGLKNDVKYAEVFEKIN